MIGRLRARIGIYRREETPDELGGASVSWVLVKVAWANIAPLQTRERYENDKLTVTMGYKVIIRFMDDFPERARLIWEGKTLRVLASSDPDNRRERLHLFCEEERQ